MESGDLQLNYALDATVRANPGAMLGPLVGVSPLEVATVPARSSLEETSLGELLPGSILSDSLETKIFLRSEGLQCIRGEVSTLSVWSQETGLLPRARVSVPRSPLGSALDLRTSLGTRYVHCPYVQIRKLSRSKVK